MLEALTAHLHTRLAEHFYGAVAAHIRMFFKQWYEELYCLLLIQSGELF